MVSGYLAKRTRGFGRWKKRWWQLTDDGMLLYFKSEDRTKALGEINISRCCYDVKFGAHQCKIDFPRAVPSCCCFSFSVLKRTYYLYAATAADAKRWTESIGSLSAVLNYSRKTTGHRTAPGPPAALQRPVSGQRVADEKRYSMPTRLPRLHASVSGDITSIPAEESAEATDQPTELPRIVKRSRGKPPRPRARGPSKVVYGEMYGSDPNLRSSAGAGGRSRHGGKPYQSSNPHLWLDGSPPPNSGRMARKRRPDLHGHHTFFSSPGGSLDKIHIAQPTLMSSSDVKALRLAGRRAHPEMLGRWPTDMDGYELPSRPQSVDISMLSGNRAPSFTHQAQRKARGVPILPYLYQDGTGRASSSSLKSTPPPIKPKPILKKTAGATVQSPDSERGTSEPSTPPEIPPKRYSLKVSVQSETGQRNIFLPPPPNFKPPPPPEYSSGDSSPKSVSSPYDRLAPPPPTGQSLAQSKYTQSGGEQSSSVQIATAQYLHLV